MLDSANLSLEPVHCCSCRVLAVLCTALRASFVSVPRDSTGAYQCDSTVPSSFLADWGQMLRQRLLDHSATAACCRLYEHVRIACDCAHTLRGTLRLLRFSVPWHVRAP